MVQVLIVKKKNSQTVFFFFLISSELQTNFLTEGRKRKASVWGDVV